MNLRIVSDSSSDLIDNETIKIVPLTIRNDKHEFVDDSSIDVNTMLETLRNDGIKSTSSCPSIGAYEEAYQGAENVYAIAISSKMSGSFNAARVASESFEGEHIAVLDSMSAGPGLHIIIDKILELKETCQTFEELEEKVNDYKLHTRLVFVLESLENFVNNGRISPVVAKAASLFGIRIISRASPAGEFDVICKKKGAKKAMAAVIEEMTAQGYEGGKVVIHHVNNQSIVDALTTKIKENYPDAVIESAPCKGLCAYYAEDQGYLLSYEVE